MEVPEVASPEKKKSEIRLRKSFSLNSHQTSTPSIQLRDSRF